MAVAIQPLNLAQILSQAEAIKSARADREHQDYLRGREQKLSDILASADITKPEGAAAIMRVDPRLGTQIRGQQIEQQRQQQQFKEEELHGLGQLAVVAINDYQKRPDQWDQIKQSLLPELDRMGLSQYKEQFLQGKPEDAMHAAQVYTKWQDPQAAIQQEQQKYQAMTGPAVERARQIAEAQAQFRQTGNAPRMSLPQGYRMNQETGQAERIPGLPADMGKQAKLPPQSALKGYQENHSNLIKIDRALTALNANPAAVGFSKGLTPDFALQRLDPEGVDARALIGDIGSLIIHERSGAAVTAAEYPRLKPFIPKINDDSETIRKKLANFKATYDQIQQDYEDTYNEDSGYRLPKLRGLDDEQGATDIPTVTSKEEARKLPSGSKFRDPTGKTRTVP